MIGLSVIAVFFFTIWSLFAHRIPIHADWNAIPIEEFFHNLGVIFFKFFQFFLMAARSVGRFRLKTGSLWPQAAVRSGGEVGNGRPASLRSFTLHGVPAGEGGLRKAKPQGCPRACDNGTDGLWRWQIGLGAAGARAAVWITPAASSGLSGQYTMEGVPRFVLPVGLRPQRRGGWRRLFRAHGQHEACLQQQMGQAGDGKPHNCAP